MTSTTTSDIHGEEMSKPASWLIRAYIAGAVSFGVVCLAILVNAR